MDFSYPNPLFQVYNLKLRHEVRGVFSKKKGVKDNFYLKMS